MNSKRKDVERNEMIYFKRPVLGIIKTSIGELLDSADIDNLMASYGFQFDSERVYSNPAGYVSSYLDTVDWNSTERNAAMVELLTQLFLQFEHLIEAGKNGESSNAIFTMAKLEMALKSNGLAWNKGIFETQTHNQKVPIQDLNKIWEPEKVRIFISHRDSKKKQAHELSKLLSHLGISGFVAHDHIEPMEEWKNEIHNALETMEGFIAMLSTDYYRSVWTNQEMGFALARKIPIFLYSLDKTDPQGFNLDIQAIKSGQDDLIRILTAKFSDHPVLKESILINFCTAINGSFHNAKIQFGKLIGLKFQNSEIERIVDAFRADANHVNQLLCLLTDQVLEEHLKHKSFNGFKLYRDALQKKVLDQHSEKKFTIKQISADRFTISG